MERCNNCGGRDYRDSCGRQVVGGEVRCGKESRRDRVRLSKVSGQVNFLSRFLFHLRFLCLRFKQGEDIRGQANLPLSSFDLLLIFSTRKNMEREERSHSQASLFLPPLLLPPHCISGPRRGVCVLVWICVAWKGPFAYDLCVLQLPGVLLERTRQPGRRFMAAKNDLPPGMRRRRRSVLGVG